MTALRAVLGAALAENHDEEIAAAGAIFRQCQVLIFRRALLEELSTELMAESPVLEGLIAYAESRAAGDFERAVELVRKRQEPRDNPTLAAEVAARRTTR